MAGLKKGSRSAPCRPSLAGSSPHVDLDALKARATTQAVAERHGCSFRREGNAIKARCPLPGHGKQRGREPGPFTVYDGGGWKCFGCGAGGHDGIALEQAIGGG